EDVPSTNRTIMLGCVGAGPLAWKGDGPSATRSRSRGHRAFDDSWPQLFDASSPRDSLPPAPAPAATASLPSGANQSMPVLASATNGDWPGNRRTMPPEPSTFPLD